MRLELFIALRYLLKTKKKRELTGASIIVVTVIAIAIIFYIASVSVMNGYILGIMKLVFEVKSFHLDYTASHSYSYSQEICDYMNADTRIKTAFIYRQTHALLSAMGKTTGLSYFRIMPETIFTDDQELDKAIRLSSGKKSLDSNEIMISQSTARKLRVNVGDSVFCSIMLSEDTSKIKIRRFIVSGIFTTGFVELDEQLAYIGRKTGEKLVGYSLPYHIGIKIPDYKDAREIAEWYIMAGYEDMETWEYRNYNELTALKFERNVIAFIVILVIFVATLNILSTIYMTVIEKHLDIGILKATGLSPHHIFVIFLFYGIFLSLTGIAIGVLFGLLIMLRLNDILQLFASGINAVRHIIHLVISQFLEIPPPYEFQVFSSDFYLDSIYTDISYPEVLMITGLTFFFSICSSIFPAIKAGMIKPQRILKNG